MNIVKFSDSPLDLAYIVTDYPIASFDDTLVTITSYDPADPETPIAEVVDLAKTGLVTVNGNVITLAVTPNPGTPSITPTVMWNDGFTYNITVAAGAIEATDGTLNTETVVTEFEVDQAAGTLVVAPTVTVFSTLRFNNFSDDFIIYVVEGEDYTKINYKNKKAIRAGIDYTAGSVYLADLSATVEWGDVLTFDSTVLNRVKVGDTWYLPIGEDLTSALTIREII